MPARLKQARLNGLQAMAYLRIYLMKINESGLLCNIFVMLFNLRSYSNILED